MSNPSPPAFDRRSRPVFHKLHEGRVEVSAIAYSIPEALAIEAAIKSAPPADAFAAVAEQLRDPANWPVADSTTTVADATTAEPPTVPEGHPALADAEDNTGTLKAGEAIETPFNGGVPIW